MLIFGSHGSYIPGMMFLHPKVTQKSLNCEIYRLYWWPRYILRSIIRTHGSYNLGMTFLHQIVLQLWGKNHWTMKYRSHWPTYISVLINLVTQNLYSMHALLHHKVLKTKQNHWTMKYRSHWPRYNYFEVNYRVTWNLYSRYDISI